MNRKMKLIIIGVALCYPLTCPPRAAENTAGNYLSPHVLAGGKGNTLYIGLATSSRVLVFDLSSERVIDEINLPDPPSGMVLSAQSSQLYVTVPTPSGEVYAVDTDTHRVRLLARTGHTPNSPVLSPDGRTLYVCNRFSDDVAIVDVASGEIRRRIRVQREPVVASLTPDGSMLVVGNLLPAGRSDLDYVAATVALIDVLKGEVVESIVLPNGSNSVLGLCLSPQGRYAYVTHILGRYQLPTTQIERGWMNTNVLTVIDLKKRVPVNTVLLDDVDRGAANPWEVRCTADGARLIVTLSGTHELCLIDREKLHARLSEAAAGERVTAVTNTAADVPNDFSFLVGAKQRIKLSGIGPRGLAVVGAKVLAAEYFTDSLAVLDLKADGRLTARSVPLQSPVTLSDVRRGERLFHDARLCFQEWQSCASCHPGSARTDALNWDLLNDGIGNPKSTKSLLLAHRTPPAMSLGVRDSAEIAVRAGIRHSLFAVRPETDALAIDRYLESLEPIPSPYLVDGGLGTGAQRGERLFQEVRCARCHNGPNFTNGKMYDVGTGLGPERSMKFDTPTLIEVWRTAAYLHDGRAATIRDVLTVFNRDDRHGRTSKLTESQIDDLVEYVLTR